MTTLESVNVEENRSLLFYLPMVVKILRAAVVDKYPQVIK
jgi:hypothetical protein